MKKTLYTLFALLLTASLISWQWEKTQYPTLEKGEVIECLNMETQQAYQLEASQSKFANLHIAPAVVNPADLLGTIVPRTSVFYSCKKEIKQVVDCDPGMVGTE